MNACLDFASRHIGPSASDQQEMCELLKVDSLEQLINETVPDAIRLRAGSVLPNLKPLSEHDALKRVSELASKNVLARSYIGMGYYSCLTPSVIQRNILENPGWYTAYTPYQAEISQGRLEAVLNFQTLICDLTGLPISNASLLDEGTAAAEAMSMCFRRAKDPSKMTFLVSKHCHPHVIDVVKTRAEPVGITVELFDEGSIDIIRGAFAVLLSYPHSDGRVEDCTSFVEKCREQDVSVIVDADLLALTLLRPPGEWGADIVVGLAQRFGVPLGFGGPHAAFISTTEEFKRDIPGRIVGVSKDSAGKPAFRLSLQTREQHIKRERATSNICTAQVLLAVMASMYAVYHGPQGLKAIAASIHQKTKRLRDALTKKGFGVESDAFFDTLRVTIAIDKTVLTRASEHKINFRSFDDGSIGVSLDEATTDEDLDTLAEVFDISLEEKPKDEQLAVPSSCIRESDYLTHEVFSKYHSETEFLRYVTRLQHKDLTLANSMIPLGSCTMKLNATTEMMPVTWKEFSSIHPFAPLSQASGYLEMFKELETMLAEVTGLPGVSLQPNAGSQGEYAGLLAIRAYHRSKGESERKICLIPQSAHGTNPASAVMAGLEVVLVKCDDAGNVDLEDLEKKASEHQSRLSAVMVTYPSTHGVFEKAIRRLVEIVHSNGGLVYMDGANMNAQVGVCRPGDFGIDVCHLNLHKTFCIPHGGGGPGVGPIAVSKDLEPFLPGHRHIDPGCSYSVGPVCSAPWGSAGILVIPYLYVLMMGGEGLRKATEVAILNANYIAHRLQGHFDVLYRGENNRVAHECILDLRSMKRNCGIDVTDVAKRLMDYGFHAPTVAFPVIETLMVEPTESESREELDRFCDALIAIREEIKAVEDGKVSAEESPLKNAPHTAAIATSDDWSFDYTREQAVYPLDYIRENKYWPPVGRIDNAWGDRNLFCTCPSPDQFS